VRELIEKTAENAHLGAMKRQGLTESPAGKWTQAEDYLGAMARKRSFRRGRRLPDRTEPEAPRMLLSTVPFLALIALLGVLAVAIMVLAFPGSQPQEKPKQVAQKEQGVAAKGWFQEAQREFHH
jgi:uncharacterized protein HemX